MKHKKQHWLEIQGSYRRTTPDQAGGTRGESDGFRGHRL